LLNRKKIAVFMQTYFRYLLILIVFLFVSLFSGAQNTNNLNSFKDFAQSYQKINRVGMWVLGSWAVGNMIVGCVSLASGLQGEGKYIQQMNVAWNLVNVGLAGFGQHRAYRASKGLLGTSL